MPVFPFGSCEQASLFVPLCQYAKPQPQDEIRIGVAMAKRSNDPTPGTDKAKVRVFFAEVEGNNESVQEALKTMVRR